MRAKRTEFVELALVIGLVLLVIAMLLVPSTATFKRWARVRQWSHPQAPEREPVRYRHPQ
jgi:hypothetical protein